MTTRWALCETWLFSPAGHVPFIAQGSEEVFFFPADAQKFKTKFEECRKEIEEREKKGNVVLVGGVLLCRLTLYPAAVPGGCFFRLLQKFLGCCDYLDLSRVMQLPRDIGCFLGK